MIHVYKNYMGMLKTTLQKAKGISQKYLINAHIIMKSKYM